MMSFSRPIHWYHSHADPIWPDGTFKFIYIEGLKNLPLEIYILPAEFHGIIQLKMGRGRMGMRT
jgi:hypothetical protein